MPRALSLRSRARIRDRITSSPGDLGAQLANVMLQHCIPATAIAALVEVTPDTVYRWMYVGNCPARVRTVLRVIERLATKYPDSFPLKGTVDDRTLSLLSLIAEHA